MKGLNYLMDHILYQIFKNILSISSKTYVNKDIKHIKIFVTKIENRITFKTKTRYYLELLIPETMKLHRSTKSKIDKDENVENVPHLEIIEAVLINCNIVNNDY